MPKKTKTPRTGRPRLPSGTAAVQRGIRFPPAMAAEIDRRLVDEKIRRPNATWTDVVLELVAAGMAAGGPTKN